jgi:MFS family permease
LILRANPWLLWGAVFLAGVSFMSFMNYISLYVRDDLGLPVAVSGDVLMIIGAVGMVGGVATGALADWIGIRGVLLLMCLLLLAAGLLVIYGATPVFLYLAALAYGIAYVGYFAMVPAYISKVYPTELSTTIFGGANFAMAIGAMLGNFLGGWSKSVLGGFSAVFVTGAIIAVLLIGLTLILKRENSPELENSLERTNNPVQ